ncbi:MAG: hypothetical protein ABS896_08280 [Carnobacterium inhibens]|uniref:hypothetical protein n=1 Tax=Carnobacterium inhibens TaxID=147709 RepID=UPI003315FC0E
MKKTKKSITDELDLLIKRQTNGSGNNLESELSLVEKLEAELKERKREAKVKLKEEEDKKLVVIARSLMKKNGFKNPEELVNLTSNRSLTEEQQEVLNGLLQDGKEVINQPTKFLDINATKTKLTHLYRAFSDK